MTMKELEERVRTALSEDRFEEFVADHRSIRIGNEPVLCQRDFLGLWVATYNVVAGRDDSQKAYAILRKYDPNGGK